MQKIFIYIVFILVFCGCKSKHKTIIDYPPTEVEKTVDIESLVTEKIPILLTDDIDSTIIKYYRNNNYKPFWLKGSLYTKGITWIHNARFHALNPIDYKINTLDSLQEVLLKDTINFANTYSKLDILLSWAIKECSKDIRISKLNPYNYHSGWNYPDPQWQTPEKFPIELILKKGFNSLDSLYEPQNALYKKLKKELITIESTTDLYNKPVIDPGFTLHPGDSNKYVLPIKHQLLNIPEDSLVSMKFNQKLQQAVILLQKKHNLIPDGIIGRNTYKYINWNNDRYIQSIKVNI